MKIRREDRLDGPALQAMLAQIAADNRAGGWRRLKAAGATADRGWVSCGRAVGQPGRETIAPGTVHSGGIDGRTRRRRTGVAGVSAGQAAAATVVSVVAERR